MSFNLTGGSSQKEISKVIARKLFGAKSKLQTATPKAKAEKLSVQQKVRLSKSDKTRLEALSKTTGRTQSSIIREGIEAFSKVQKGKKEIVINGTLFTPAKTLKARKL